MICASVLALGLLVSARSTPARAEAPQGEHASAPARAEALQDEMRPHHHHRYRVYYFSPGDGDWILYSTHRRYWRALEFARYLQSLGYQTWVG
jgi:hypothetical protein